jgi:hypothetical protein
MVFPAGQDGVTRENASFRANASKQLRAGLRVVFGIMLVVAVIGSVIAMLGLLVWGLFHVYRAITG